jgi:hypothetical protein
MLPHEPEKEQLWELPAQNALRSWMVATRPERDNEDFLDTALGLRARQVFFDARLARGAKPCFQAAAVPIPASFQVSSVACCAESLEKIRN